MSPVEGSRTQVLEKAADAGQRHDLSAGELRSFLARYFRDVADEDLRDLGPRRRRRRRPAPPPARDAPAGDGERPRVTADRRRARLE